MTMTYNCNYQLLYALYEMINISYLSPFPPQRNKGILVCVSLIGVLRIHVLVFPNQFGKCYTFGIYISITEIYFGAKQHNPQGSVSMDQNDMRD